MQLQPEFFLHIINGEACDAGPLLARLALNLGHDPVAFPFDVTALQTVSDFARKPNSCGVNELFVVEYLRAAVMGGARPWTQEEVGMLLQIAARPIPARLSCA